MTREQSIIFFFKYKKVINYTSRATLWQKIVLKRRQPLKHREPQLPSNSNFVNHGVPELALL